VSGDQAPWWYSGDDEPGTTEPADEPAGEPGQAQPGLDWTVLAAGAQRLVDWATERVVAPHAEHDDPREHPQCVVCRAMVVIGDRGAAFGGSSAPGTAGGAQPDGGGPAGGGDGGHATAPDHGGIVWIPIVEEFGGP
jgi:hypothetical protein